MIIRRTLYNYVRKISSCLLLGLVYVNPVYLFVMSLDSTDSTQSFQSKGFATVFPKFRKCFFCFHRS